MSQPLLGDIILYPVSPRSSLSSRIIAIGQLLLGRDRGMEQYSHVGIYDKDGWQIEAIWPWSKRTRIDLKRPLEIWRFHGINSEQRVKVMDWAYEHLGEKYDILYILSFTMLRYKKGKVCCTYAMGAYAHAGLHILASRPDQIVSSGKMYCVQDNFTKRGKNG